MADADCRMGRGKTRFFFTRFAETHHSIRRVRREVMGFAKKSAFKTRFFCSTHPTKLGGIVQRRRAGSARRRSFEAFRNFSQVNVRSQRRAGDGCHIWAGSCFRSRLFPADVAP